MPPPRKTAKKKATKARPAAKRRRAPARRAAARTTQPPSRGASRADFGAPVAPYFARPRPPPLPEILEALREVVEEAVPDAEASIKWGAPCYTVKGAAVCALGAHRAHVNLVLWGPGALFADPEGRLSGEGNVGRILKLTALDELPRAAARRWIRAAAAHARAKG
jgi:hypothetical protein